MGEADFVKETLEKLGSMSFWKIAMKPGRPVTFDNIDDAVFFGLPGNPVSVFATFCLFVTPFIKKMQGRTDLTAPLLKVRVDFDWPHPDNRKEFLRARLHLDQQHHPSVSIYHNQSSGVLTSTSWADGFVIVHEGQPIGSGDMVDYLSFKELLG